MVHATRLDDPPTVLAGAPGEVVVVARDRVWVATGEGLLGLTELQLENKKRLSAREFLAGHPLRPGTMLGQA
jgi:methionyl-tRNA formyltransferase